MFTMEMSLLSYLLMKLNNYNFVIVCSLRKKCILNTVIMSFLYMDGCCINMFGLFLFFLQLVVTKKADYFLYAAYNSLIFMCWEHLGIKILEWFIFSNSHSKNMPPLSFSVYLSLLWLRCVHLSMAVFPSCLSLYFALTFPTTDSIFVLLWFKVSKLVWMKFIFCLFHLRWFLAFFFLSLFLSFVNDIDLGFQLISIYIFFRNASVSKNREYVIDTPICHLLWLLLY